MDWILKEKGKLNTKEEFYEDEYFHCNPEDSNEKSMLESDSEDIKMKLEACITEEFDIKDEFSDNDSDIDIQTAKPAKMASTDQTINWPEEDLTTLIAKIELSLPDKDSLAYSTRVEKLNWDDIKFKEYSGADCKKTWLLIQKRLRRFRLLSEVLQDAKEWVSKPWTDYYRRKQTKNCPDMPRRPLSVYMLFYLKMKDKIVAENPDLEMPEVTKQISQIYKNLTPEEREKYTSMAMNEKKIYEGRLEEFYRIHPEIPRHVEKPAEIKTKKPSTPFYLYYQDQLKNTSNPDHNAAKEECKKQWKNLPDKEKLVWINLALDNEAKYQDELKDYITHNPDFIPATLKPILTKEEKSLKERLAGKPVKPPTSAYSLFTAMMLQSEEIKKIPPKERMKAVADEWKNSSDEERKPFQERVNELMKQYKEDFALYLESLPEYKRQEEAQNVPKRKIKNVEKTEKTPEKKKTPNKEINFDNIIKAEPPSKKKKSNEINFDKIITAEPPEKKKTPNKEINFDNIIKAEPPEKKKTSNKEINFDEIITAEPPEKKKTPNKEINFDNIIKAEPPEKKKTSNKEINFDNIIKAEPPSKKKKSNKEINFDNIIKAEPTSKKKKSNEEINFDKIITAELPEKKKKSKEEINFEKIIKAEPPQPPLSGFDLFSCRYKGPSPVKTAWKNLVKPEKEKYEQEVKKMKQKYIKKYEEFLKSLSKKELLTFSQLKHKRNEANLSDTKNNEPKDSSDSDDSNSEID